MAAQGHSTVFDYVNLKLIFPFTVLYLYFLNFIPINISFKYSQISIQKSNNNKKITDGDIIIHRQY